MMVEDQSLSINVEAAEAAAKLSTSIEEKFRPAVIAFEARWRAWQADCVAIIAQERSLEEVIETESFAVLKSLGPKVVPFVVAKLAENKDENLCGVYLYNELERVEEYRVNLGEALPEISLYKTRATEIVELNYQRQKLYDELMHIWKEDYLEQKLTASVHTLCVGEEYEGIIALGPSIIGSVLLEYTADRGGWWYEMLHHLIHGRTMQAHAIFGRSKLLDQWSDFFNYEEFDKAPLYIPNEWDIYILTGVKGPAVEAEHQRRGR